jgi:hypothetical protein
MTVNNIEIFFTKLLQTSTLSNAFVGSESVFLGFDCPLGAEFNPNFSRCSKWLALTRTGSSVS